MKLVTQVKLKMVLQPKPLSPRLFHLSVILTDR
jgi:hypothetical protein